MWFLLRLKLFCCWLQDEWNVSAEIKMTDVGLKSGVFMIFSVFQLPKWKTSAEEWKKSRSLSTKERKGEPPCLKSSWHFKEPLRHLVTSYMSEELESAVSDRGHFRVTSQNIDNVDLAVDALSVYWSASLQHRGVGRRHAAHRRLLSPASHVWGQKPAVRLHPL